MTKNQFERCQRFLVGHLSSPGSMPQSPFVLELSRKSSPGARAVGGQEFFLKETWKRDALGRCWWSGISKRKVEGGVKMVCQQGRSTVDTSWGQNHLAAKVDWREPSPHPQGRAGRLQASASETFSTFSLVLVLSSFHWAASSHSWESSQLTEHGSVGRQIRDLVIWYFSLFIVFTCICFACGVSGFRGAVQISHRGWECSQLAESCLARLAWFAWFAGFAGWGADHVKPPQRRFFARNSWYVFRHRMTLCPYQSTIELITLSSRRISLLHQYY